MVVETVVYTLHTAFAALWVGSVVFVTLAIVPLAIRANLSPDAFGHVVSTLAWITRSSAVVLLLTGGHLAGTRYDVGTLTGTTSGWLVLAMLALWAGLAVVVEIGSARARRGVAERKIREPARRAAPFYRLGVVFAVGLLIVAGVLGTPAVLP